MKRRGFLASIFAAALAPFVGHAVAARTTVPWRIQYRAVKLNEDWMAYAERQQRLSRFYDEELPNPGPVLQYGDYLTFGRNTSATMPAEVRVALDRRRHELAREIGKRIFQKPTEYIWLPTVPGDRERAIAYGGVKFWL